MGKLIVCLACLLISLPLPASVVFDSGTRTLIVADFTESAPARLESLLRADRANGWNLVRKDAGAQTYAVNANLQVGRNDGSETWMQIGCPLLTNETLILNGTLILAPSYLVLVVGVKNRYAPARVNRLTLGNRTNSAIRAALKISGEDHTVFCGKLPDGRGGWQKGYGGELHIYHGVLASASGRREIPRPYWSGLVTLYRARVAGFKAAALFGAARHRTSIHGSIFENNASVFGSPDQAAEGCCFRENAAVITGIQGNTILLHGCRFERNACNWQLTSGGNIELTDCQVSPGAQPDVYAAQPGRISRAVFRRQVVVRVENDAGEPVARARVRAVPREPGADLVANNYAVTGADGCTPDIGDPRALIFTRSITAGDAHGAPVTTCFHYDIIAELNGRAISRLENYAPPAGCDKIAIRLKQGNN